jgi:uncharacterized protein (TIGR04222 family)
MDWLTDNPIANLHGFDFLGFYLCVSILTIVICWAMVRNSDKSISSTPPLEIPQNPDPYEIAYLRGKENEMIRLAVFNLINKGYLSLGTSYLEKQTSHPDPSFLPNLEKSLFGWICQQTTTVTESSVTKTIIGVKPYEIFSRFSGMTYRAKAYGESYKERLTINHLINAQEVKQAAWGIGTAGALVILCLAGYKVAVAASQGRHNVGFTIALSIISLIVLIIACVPPRLSRRGKQYLKELQQAFANLAQKERLNVATPGFDPQVPAVAMAIFGVGILAGTSFGSFEQSFHRSASSGGGCGSGCGSGSSCSSGGSSCGGGSCGGGGCGGGGCGG